MLIGANIVSDKVDWNKHMRRKSPLISTMPSIVEMSIQHLGINLRTARLRRNMSLEEVASRLGVSRYVVSHAEAGKASTSIAVYVGLLWVYGLMDHFSAVADPAQDKEGMSLSLANDRLHARRAESLNNDF